MASKIKHCISCGSTVELKQIEPDEPKRHVCTSCDRIHYENPVPTAGALFVQDGKILLVRRSTDPCKGEWDIPGGFLEKDEHPEDALRREMKEELDVEITIDDQVGIFVGDYADSALSTLNIYYRASIVSGEPKPRSDIDRAEWFALDALPPIAFSQNEKVVAVLQRQLTFDN